MSIADHWRSLTSAQRKTFLACFAGWALDAFDFFLLTLTLTAVAGEFHVSRPTVANALFWTLAMRPVGALLFGAMAERWGRRPTLMLNIVAFSLFELLSGLAPTWTLFLLCRALFGVAMGGEWGVGAALALETLPARGRGFFSGLLQEGYVVGNLLAGALVWLLYPHLQAHGFLTPWRILFLLGSLPALLALYLRMHVPESPAWQAARAAEKSKPQASRFTGLVSYLPSFLLLVVLMSAFAAFSHGTQDLYPSFLQQDKGMRTSQSGLVVVLANVGALLGGITCGAFSERLGRRRVIIAASLLAIPMIPLWAYSHSLPLLALGGFLMQFMVQGAWGVVPAYLNELAPAPVRATFPGLAYQLGNLLMSRNQNIQAALAKRYPGGLTTVLAGTVVLVAVLLAVIACFARESAGADLQTVTPEQPG